MKRILALALATILVSQLQAHAQTPTLPKPVAPTIEQLAAFPALSSLTVSPDGSRIAGLEANGEDRVIVVYRTDALDKPPTRIGSDRM